MPSEKTDDVRGYTHECGVDQADHPAPVQHQAQAERSNGPDDDACSDLDVEGMSKKLRERRKQRKKQEDREDKRGAVKHVPRRVLADALEVQQPLERTSPFRQGPAAERCVRPYR